MRYEFSEELQKQAEEISKILFPHIDMLRVKCFKSFGTSSKGTIARCHTIGKLMQKAIGVKPHYALEFISERFDKLNEDEKTKVVIHELMHIPKTFGGGFKHHDWVTTKNVNLMFKEFKQKTNINKEEKNETENKIKNWWQ